MNAVATESKPAVTWMNNFAWLVKRELWEHRALYIAPLVFSGVIVVSALYAMLVAGHGQFGHISIGGDEHMPSGPRLFILLLFTAPFAFVAAVVTVFYALDALYADRRDRSFLFWKSLPVSDMETVVAKLTVATLVAPIIAVVISLATQLVVLVAFSIWMAANGHSFLRLWTEIPVLENLLVLIYAIVVLALWYLPIWAWCLLASAWARRAPFLWATAPIGAAWLLEYQSLGTNHIGHFLLTRLAGAIPLATSVPMAKFNEHAQTQGSVLHVTDVLAPGALFSSPQLWGGLFVAAGLIAATVWVRRYREEA
jgi:ABC-2 type transport system permease protein